MTVPSTDPPARPSWATGPTMTIPVPQLLPLGIPLNSASTVQDVWDAFVKPGQDAGMPQSIEMRSLMAILRAVAAPLHEPDDAPTQAAEAVARINAQMRQLSEQMTGIGPKIEKALAGVRAAVTTSDPHASFLAGFLAGAATNEGHATRERAEREWTRHAKGTATPRDFDQ